MWPIRRNNRLLGILCMRVPNDVIGDLIQREGGHVFHESGDNYLFMAKSVFDPTIRPGVALSRSRFEDRSFSLGDNLKDGVRTDYGTVQVRNHTEFELPSMTRRPACFTPVYARRSSAAATSTSLTQAIRTIAISR